MRISLVNRYMSSIAVLAVLTTVSACSSVPSKSQAPMKVATCDLSGTKKLELAMDDAKAKLQTGCESHFDSYLAQLMQVGKGFPKESNSAIFQEYLRWSVNQGMVSKVQASDRYNRYFSSTFNTLNMPGSVATSVCPKLDQVLNDLQAELKDKKLGIQEVNGNSAKYQNATRLYYELELNLEAICIATADRTA